MNMFKKNGGFTLVELIVVIAILAILASIAVPAYSGYIKKANESANQAAAVAVKTAVYAAYAEKGENPPAEITITNGVPQGIKYEEEYKFYLGNTDVTKANGTWNLNVWTATGTTTPTTDPQTANN